MEEEVEVEVRDAIFIKLKESGEIGAQLLGARRRLTVSGASRGTKRLGGLSCLELPRTA